MPNQKLKFDFFKIETPPTSEPFPELLSKIWGSSSHRHKLYEGIAVRIRNFERTAGENCTGDLNQLRMKNLPTSGGLHKDDEPLDLPSDEGLSYGRAFLFDEKLKVLVLQRSKQAPNDSVICDFIRELAAVDGLISFLPMLSHSGYMKLLNNPKPKKFELRVAGVTNPAVLAGGDLALASIGKVMESLGAPKIDLEVSFKKGRLSLSIMELAKKLLSGGGGSDSGLRHIEKAKLWATDEEEKNGLEELDLLELRLWRSVQVTYADSRHQIGYPERKKAASRAYQDCLPELKTICEPTTNTSTP